MTPSAVITTVCWGAFALWVIGGVLRDTRAYRRMLSERREVTPCEYRRGLPPLTLGAPPAHPHRRRPL